MSDIVTYEKPTLAVVGAAQARAGAVVVADQTTLELATELARGFKASRDQWEAKRKTYADPLNKLKQQVQDDFMPILQDFDAAIATIKHRIGHYASEQERIRIAAQAEADAAARRAAVAAEKAAKAAEKKGDVEKAEAIREVAAVSSAVVVAPTVHHVSGTSVRRPWKGRVVDKAEAIKALLAAGYVDMLDIDATKLNKLVNFSEGKQVIRGVEPYQDSIVSLRT